MAPDFSLDALCIGVADPRSYLTKLRAGSPIEITDLAQAFAAAAGDLQLAKELTEQSQKLVAASYSSGASTSVDYAGEAALAGQLKSDEELVAIAKRLDVIADDLAETTAYTSNAIDTLVTEVDQIAATYDALVRNTAVAIEQLDSAATAYVLKARSLVKQCGSAVSAWTDTYQQHLHNSVALLAELGFVAPAGLDEGPGDTTPVGLACIPPPSAEPTEVANWWQTASLGEQAALIAGSWVALSGLHGLPSPAADRVNRNKLAADKVAYSNEVNSLKSKLVSNQQANQTSSNSLTSQLDKEKFLKEQAEIKAKLAVAQQKLDNVNATEASLAANHGGLLLRYDAWGNSGEGASVIAIGGNPDTADNVAVNVPGTNNSVSENGTNRLTHQIRTGQTLETAMDSAAPGEDNVVIVYQGYESPDTLLSAGSSKYAEDGAPALKADLAGWAAAASAAGGKPHTTLVAHSYGTVLAAKAIQDGAVVDDYVAVGSPGMEVADTEELGMNGDNVWVGAAPDDPAVGAAGVYNDNNGTTAVDATRWGIDWLSDLLSDPHGPAVPSDGQSVQTSINDNAPQSEGFGAKVFSTAGSHGHSEYFSGESLRNIAAVATDNDDQVEVIADN